MAEARTLAAQSPPQARPNGQTGAQPEARDGLTHALGTVVSTEQHNVVDVPGGRNLVRPRLRALPEA
eukprot:1762909-Lingulodinium_polyedra.AAC.1